MCGGEEGGGGGTCESAEKKVAWLCVLWKRSMSEVPVEVVVVVTFGCRAD